MDEEMSKISDAVVDDLTFDPDVDAAVRLNRSPGSGHATIP
jgi:hypothetical protein